MRFLFLTSFLAFALNASFAQKITFYLKNNGKTVTERDSADFMRTILPADDDKYQIQENYKNGNLKLEGFVTKYNPSLSLEGLVKKYFENGSKQEEAIYLKNQIVGEANFYYENGQIKEVLEYSPNNEPFKTKVKVISFFDSTGVQLVKNGTGFYNSLDKNGTFINGKYLNGVKDSVWRGGNIAKNYSYTETYEAGKFLSGVSKIEDKEFSYSSDEIMPEYPGGIMKFYDFVGRTYNYPEAAKRSGVSGRVILTFVVEKDGSITEIKLLRDLGLGTGEEAVRVLEKSKKWNPGRQHGIPVRVSYTLPIMLNLSAR